MKTSLLIAGSLALVPMTYAQDKPNIIIILADDLGFSDLGCFGGEIIHRCWISWQRMASV